jgi:hypothetical protein
MSRVMTIAVVIGVLLAAIAFGWQWNNARTSDKPDAAAKAASDIGKATDDPGAEWQAEVVLEQSGESNPGDERGRLTIVLRNARGKEIETPATSFEIDGTPLNYRVGQGNFYDRHPYYLLDEDARFDFAADASYELTIRRNNESAVPFARIRTPAAMLPVNFQVPVQHPDNRELVMQWTSLHQQAELLIYRTRTLADAEGNQTIDAGGPYADDAIRQAIGPDERILRDGRHVIPAHYFAASPAGKVSALTIEITAANNGQFLHPVLKRSVITARRRIVFHVEVMAAQER